MPGAFFRLHPPKIDEKRGRMNSVISIYNPAAIGLLVFSLLFFIPTTRLVIKLSIESTILQWLMTMAVAALNTVLLAVALSFLTD